MSAAMIALQGLRFAYSPEAPAVFTDLSLEIPPGTATAILGPNGAGKTTLLHLILGLLKPQAGRILLKGRERTSYSRTAFSRLVGLVPQIETTPFDFSVLEYILLGRTPYLKPLEMPRQADYQAAANALETLGITELKDRPVPELSGGEHQMVLLARALAQGPRILLLDEPTAHLDLGNKDRILRLLGGLVAQGVTVLFTSHDPETASFLASYLITMRAGQVLESGPLEEVLTEEVLAETYQVPVRVHRIDGRLVVLLDHTSDDPD